MKYRILYPAILFFLLPLLSSGQLSLVKNLLPQSVASSNPIVTESCVVKDQLFFTSGDKSACLLWVSDGTNSGTRVIKSFPDYAFDTWDRFVNSRLFNLENQLLLFFVLDEHGEALWRSDGTEAGTFKIKNVTVPHFVPSQTDPLVVSGNLYFVNTDSIQGAQLWKTDGTIAGTMEVKSIYSTRFYDYNNFYVGSPQKFIAHQGMLYFWTNDSIHGMELWKSDGTTPGTQMVKDINIKPGAGSYTFPQYGKGSNEASVNKYLFFEAKDASGIANLWRSDGSDTGTRSLGFFNNLQNLIDFNGSLLFMADSNGVPRLGMSDGSIKGTYLLPPPALIGNQYSSIIQTGRVKGNILYAIGTDERNGMELWHLEKGKPAPEIIKDIWPGSANGFNYFGFAKYDSFNITGNILYFAAEDGVHGRELWRSDNTGAGTYMVADLVPGIRSSSPDCFATLGNDLYFIAQNDTGMSQLWKYNTKAGVHQPQIQNPFKIYYANRQLVIRNNRPMAGIITLNIYNMNGQRITCKRFSGSEIVDHFDVPPIPQGIYFYRLRTDNELISDKIWIRGE
jgi:ELWxxDGT repeat protein